MSFFEALLPDLENVPESSTSSEDCDAAEVLFLLEVLCFFADGGDSAGGVDFDISTTFLFLVKGAVVTVPSRRASPFTTRLAVHAGDEARRWRGFEK